MKFVLPEIHDLELISRIIYNRYMRLCNYEIANNFSGCVDEINNLKMAIELEKKTYDKMTNTMKNYWLYCKIRSIMNDNVKLSDKFILERIANNLFVKSKYHFNSFEDIVNHPSKIPNFEMEKIIFDILANPCLFEEQAKNYSKIMNKKDRISSKIRNRLLEDLLYRVFNSSNTFSNKDKYIIKNLICYSNSSLEKTFLDHYFNIINLKSLNDNNKYKEEYVYNFYKDEFLLALSKLSSFSVDEIKNNRLEYKSLLLYLKILKENGGQYLDNLFNRGPVIDEQKNNIGAKIKTCINKAK